ncbi:putative DNA binding domain-containing protein [Candidatus Halobeggiatoa sp. HSG11]|nr:putative DNA binding domain-containing protein [Candidatus Halobeggiatoa sp. HSG11]
METSELIEIIARDEDSKHQFKANVTNEISLAQEMIALSNTLGGMIIIGVSDDGSIFGLTRKDMGRLNNLVSNTGSQQVKPSINPITENIALDNGLVMVVHILRGISKPYMDKNGVIWVKNGADKRKATAREEIQRMFQNAGLIHGDETPVSNLTIADIDTRLFSEFYEKQYGEALTEQQLPLKQIVENLNLSRDGFLNVAGAILFGKNISYKLPAFIVKCVTYPDIDIDEDRYIDSQDISGTLKNVFDDTLGFVLRNIRRVQNDQNVNSLGELEIPKVVFEELIVNALIHRDYFISAPIKIFVFINRIEIISPGHLPNNLTIENIKNGNSNIRNPILASFATKLLPYRGLGSGIRRAIKAYNKIDFFEDRNGNIFKAIIDNDH